MLKVREEAERKDEADHSNQTLRFCPSVMRQIWTSSSELAGR